MAPLWSSGVGVAQCNKTVGLICHPSLSPTSSDNFKEAIHGYTFKSVSDIVAAAHTPRMVRILTAASSPSSTSKDSPDRSPVSRSDLLVIKKTGRTLMRKPFIKVFSFNTKEEKTLYVCG